jgi:predicted DNA-binding transcriptional regulator YafY
MEIVMPNAKPNKESNPERLITMSRQWAILRMLPKSHQAGLSAPQIHEKLCAAEYKIGLKAVQTDMNFLESIMEGAIIHEGKSPKLWKWKAGHAFEKIVINEVDALSLCLLEPVLRRMLPESYLQIDARLELAKSVRDHLGLKQRLRYVEPGPGFLPPEVNAEIRNEIYTALQKGLKIEAHYYNRTVLRDNPDQPQRLRRLNPLGLVQRGVEAFLVATEEGENKVKFYALHRFGSAKIYYENANIPSDFDLDKYLAAEAQFGCSKPIDLKARISASVAVQLRGTPLSKNQQLSADENGHIMLQATVVDSLEFRWWLVSRWVEVLEPVELRQDIKQQIEAYCRCYSE